MSKRNPCLEAARDEIERRGGVVVSVEHTGRSHLRVTLALAEPARQAPSMTRFIIMAGTCSDARALERVRSDVRREIGILSSVLSPDEARAYHRRDPCGKRSAGGPAAAGAQSPTRGAAIPMTTPPQHQVGRP